MLQLVVVAPHTQLNRNNSTNVRYASACRWDPEHSTPQEWVNEWLRFLLGWVFGITTTSWSISDIRWVIPGKLSVRCDDDKLKRIGHSVPRSCQVECGVSRRQAEAYRTFGCAFLSGWASGTSTTSWSVSDIRWRVPVRLSVGHQDDKLKRIGHSLVALLVVETLMYTSNSSFCPPVAGTGVRTTIRVLQPHELASRIFWIQKSRDIRTYPCARNVE